jgi:hypothetical protein
MVRTPFHSAARRQTVGIAEEIAVADEPDN